MSTCLLKSCFEKMLSYLKPDWIATGSNDREDSNGRLSLSFSIEMTLIITYMSCLLIYGIDIIRSLSFLISR